MMPCFIKISQRPLPHGIMNVPNATSPAQSGRRRKMGEEDYATYEEFFDWLWHDKLTQKERERYEKEFEREKDKFLPPGFAD